MKYLMLICLLMVTACTSSNQYGKCVGVNSDNKDPTLMYEYSTNNIVWGLLGTQFFLIPPAIVLFKELECPVGKK